MDVQSPLRWLPILGFTLNLIWGLWFDDGISGMLLGLVIRMLVVLLVLVLAGWRLAARLVVFQQQR